MPIADRAIVRSPGGAGALAEPDLKACCEGASSVAKGIALWSRQVANKHKLSTGCRLVLSRLAFRCARFPEDDDLGATMAIATLARGIKWPARTRARRGRRGAERMSSRTAGYAITRLEALGLVRRTRRSRADGGYAVSLFHVPAVAALPDGLIEIFTEEQDCYEPPADPSAKVAGPICKSGRTPSAKVADPSAKVADPSAKVAGPHLQKWPDPSATLCGSETDLSTALPTDSGNVIYDGSCVRSRAAPGAALGPTGESRFTKNGEKQEGRARAVIEPPAPPRGLSAEDRAAWAECARMCRPERDGTLQSPCDVCPRNPSKEAP